MKMVIQFNMDNAAFSDCPAYEAARILRVAADKIENGSAAGELRDYNGNKVGQYAMKFERRGKAA